MQNGYAPESWFRYYKSKQRALFKIYLNQETRFWIEKCLFPERHTVYLSFKLDWLPRWLERPGTIFVITFNRQRACFYYLWPWSTAKHLFLNLCDSVRLSEAVTYPRLSLAWVRASSSHPRQGRLCTAHLSFLCSTPGGVASK